MNIGQSDAVTIGEYNEQGKLMRGYYYSPQNNLANAPVAIKHNDNGITQTSDYQNDHLNTPQMLTRPNGAIVWQGQYDAFGEVTQTNTQVSNPLRFPGQYQDDETGLHYNWYRYYDNSIGGYVTRDPIGLLKDYSDPQLQIAIEIGLLEIIDSANEELNHSYGYVGQNPVRLLDEYGLSGRANSGDGSATGKNTNKPYKHCRNHPTDPNKIICRKKGSGKKVTLPKPSDWPNEKKAPLSCNDICQAGLVLVGGACLATICVANPIVCGIAIGGGVLTQ